LWIEQNFDRKEFESEFETPIVTTAIIGTPQMVFTNLIMTIHVNKTVDQPLMNSMVARRYKITNAKNPKGRY
jgi:hypothetical protein